MNTKFSFFLKKIVAVCSAVVLLIVSSGLLSVVPAEATTAGWYSAAWPYRLPITIDHTKVATSLTDFPVLISVTKPELQKALTDGNGLLFTAADGRTKLDHDIESFEIGSGTLVAWVKVPALSSAVDTVLYLYYGNSAADQQNKPGTWSSDFRLVQHMDSANMHIDVSGNGNDGNTTGAPTVTPARAGNGNHFNGASDAVIVPDSASLSFTEALTSSFWLKTDVTPDISDASENGVYGKVNNFWTDSWGFYFSVFDHGALDFFVNHYLDHVVTATVTPTDWMYVVATYDRSAIKLYVNGQLKNSVAYTDPIAVNNFNLSISRLSAASDFYDTDGTFDEVRLAAVARTGGWVATEYANQNEPTTFAIFGTEETYEATKHVVITGATTQMAGSEQTIALTLTDGTGSAVAGFTGEKTVTFSGATVSGGNIKPTCTDRTDTAVPFGAPTTITFLDGTATCVLKLAAAETAVITATVDTFSTTQPADTLSVLVIAAPLDSFVLAAPNSVVYNQSFLFSATAKDAYGNTVTSTTADATLGVSSGGLDVVTLQMSAFADDGVATTTLTLGGTGVTTPTTLTLTSGGVSASITFAVTDFPQTGSSQGGVNYSSGTGGGGVGGPPPETLPVSTSTPVQATTSLPSSATPSAPSSQPVASEPISPPSRPVIQPAPTPQPVVKPPVRPVVPKPPTTRPSVPTTKPIPVKPPIPLTPQVLVAYLARNQQAVPVTLERLADGTTKKKMTVSTDGNLNLALKLTEKVRSVRGYLLPVATAEGNGVLIGQPKASDEQYQFTYTDSDKDGIYTAQIPTGVIGRNSELVTVVDYDNLDKPREIVDVLISNLAGHILDAKKNYLSKAFVTLLKLNEVTDEYERWPAEEQGRPNPVLTEETGHYYFDPPPGTYRLEVIKEGYDNYTSEPLTIGQGQAVNFDVTLRTSNLFTGQNGILSTLWEKLKSVFQN